LRFDVVELCFGYYDSSKSFILVGFVCCAIVYIIVALMLINEVKPAGRPLDFIHQVARPLKCRAMPRHSKVPLHEVNRTGTYVKLYISNLEYNILFIP
jgi:hypothetical protein